MTDNYQQKISVLEQQLHQLKKEHPSSLEEEKKDMLEKIVSYFLHKLNKNENLYERLPIRRIDDMKLDVFIKSYKHQTTKIYLMIEDAIPELACPDDDCIIYHEYFRKDFELKNVNAIEVKKVVEEIRHVLNHLEFCKLRGTLVQKENHAEEISLVWKSLIEAENIQWSANECVVCLDETFSKTICGHHLCRCCFQKLRTFKCPTCRRPLSYNDDSDSEEEED